MRRSQQASSICTVLTLGLMVCAALPARAGVVVLGGTKAQQTLVATIYSRALPGRFRRAQPLRIRFLSDDAMTANIHDGGSHDRDDQDSIDGIYQDDPPVILLRASRPDSELGFVFAHEYGHFVWRTLLSENQHAVFQRLYAVDRDDHHLVTDYAEESPDEGFAETFSVFTLYPHRLAQAEPRVFQFLSALAVPGSGRSQPARQSSHREWEEQDPTP